MLHLLLLVLVIHGLINERADCRVVVQGRQELLGWMISVDDARLNQDGIRTCPSCRLRPVRTGTRLRPDRLTSVSRGTLLRLSRLTSRSLKFLVRLRDDLDDWVSVSVMGQFQIGLPSNIAKRIIGTYLDPAARQREHLKSARFCILDAVHHVPSVMAMTSNGF